MKVFLIGVDYFRGDIFSYYMEELENLAQACGYEVVGVMTQKLQKFDSKHYFGSGKIVELIEQIDDLEPDLVIVNDELKGSQNRNLEEALNVKIMDRTQLILEIFAARANTKEAKLQVSIAQLKYQKPRMLGSYDNLSRQGGGKAGTIARGSGETKLEVDKRKIDDQISLIEKELQKYVASRSLQRVKRTESLIPIVAVVGYTNAGKSTLMNYFVDEDKSVFEKDMLFATLDTSVRKVVLDNNQQFILVDTVGFVSNLPHELVNAFRSTLEEVLEANLIIHLSDVSDPDVELHKDVVRETLDGLGASDIKTINVNNKVDKLDVINESEINISAKYGNGIDDLVNEISKSVFEQYQLCELHLPYSEIRLESMFREYTYVSESKYDEAGCIIEVILSPIDIEKYSKYIKSKKGIH